MLWGMKCFYCKADGAFAACRYCTAALCGEHCLPCGELGEQYVCEVCSQRYYNLIDLERRHCTVCQQPATAICHLCKTYLCQSHRYLEGDLGRYRVCAACIPVYHAERLQLSDGSHEKELT
jgi:hypothetical protein